MGAESEKLHILGFIADLWKFFDKKLACAEKDILRLPKFRRCASMRLYWIMPQKLPRWVKMAI
jgi:hypothetical protein